MISKKAASVNETTQKEADRSGKINFADLHRSLVRQLDELLVVLWAALDVEYRDKLTKSEKSIAQRLDGGPVPFNSSVSDSDDWTQAEADLADEWRKITAKRLDLAEIMRDQLSQIFFDRDKNNFNEWAVRQPTASAVIKAGHGEFTVVHTRLNEALGNPIIVLALYGYQLYMRANQAEGNRLSVKQKQQEMRMVLAELALVLYVTLVPESFTKIASNPKLDEGPERQIESFIRMVLDSAPSTGLKQRSLLSSNSELPDLLLFKALSSEDQSRVRDFAEDLEAQLSKGLKIESLSLLIRAQKLSAPLSPEASGIVREVYKSILNLRCDVIDHRSELIPDQNIRFFEIIDRERLLEFVDRAVDKAVAVWENQAEKAKKRAELERQLNERNKIAEAERAKAEAMAKLEQLKEFHSKHQTPPFPSNAAELIERLKKTGVTTQLHSAKAACLELMETYQLLDYRGKALESCGDPAIKELVEVVYSRENLTRLAETHGLSSTKYLTNYLNPSEDFLEGLTQRLSAFYHGSPYLREQITDIFLSDSKLCVLIGSICLAQNEVSGYVAKLLRPSGEHEVSKKEHGKFLKRIVSRLEDTNTKRIIKDELRKRADKGESGSSTASSRAARPDWFSELQDSFGNLILEWYVGDGRCLVIPKEEPSAAFYLSAKQFKDKNRIFEDLDGHCRRAVADFKMRDAAEKMGESGFKLEVNSKGEIERIIHESAAINIPVTPDKKEWYKFEKALSKHSKYQRRLMESAIKAAQTAQEQSEQKERLEAQRRERAQKKREVEVQEVLPRDGEPIMILDTSALFALLSPVDPLNEKVTYLHVLSESFAHSGGRLFIPAKVLFEASGKAYWLDAERAVQTVEIVNRDVVAEKNIADIISRAAHLRFTSEKSNPHIAKGKGHAAVVYGPDDEELFDRAKAHYTASAGKAIKFRERFIYRCIGNQLGDMAINDLVGFITANCPVVVATVDGSHVRHSLTLSTSGGAQTKAIGWMQLIEYLCKYEGCAFKRLGIDEPPQVNDAIDQVLEYLSSRELGGGAQMRPDGDMIIGPDDLAEILG
jgi:hypothetical protein